MRKSMFTLKVIILTGCLAQVSNGQDLDDSGNPVPVMFVQTAKGVKFTKGKMTLLGINPSTMFFSDRPERLAGHLPTSHFLKIWSQGRDSFKNDPPNANLSILGEKEGVINIVLELSNPRVEGKNMAYDIRILEGVPPENGGVSSLFIDWLVTHGRSPYADGLRPDLAYKPYYGPRVVCRRNWYTGRRWCHVKGPYY